MAFSRKKNSLKVKERSLRDHARMVGMNRWLTALEIDVIKRRVMNENADNNDQNIGIHECKYLLNILRYNVNLSSGNVEGMRD